MAEILFYHLTERTLEQVLPGLVEKSLERGWKVAIQASSRERVESLDTVLWTFRDEEFLPHGSIRDGTEAMQPVWLTDRSDNPNGAHIRFLVDGASVEKSGDYQRLVYLFDGHNNLETDAARQHWRHHVEQGKDALTYWQQKPNGSWEKKHEQSQ